MVKRPSLTSSNLNSVIETSILPASIFARSRISLIKLRSCSPELRMFPAQRICFSVKFWVLINRSLKPRIEFNGVLSSCDIFAKKSLFSLLDSNNAKFACANSSTFRSRLVFTFFNRSCMLTRFLNIRLNAWLRSSNSSPVWISLRTFNSPALIASLTSFKCLTGFTITYRTIR